MSAAGYGVVKLLEDTYGTDDLGNVSVKAATGPDGNEVFYANAGVSTSGIILKTATAEAGVSLMRILQSKGLQVEQVDFHILRADASASAGLAYVGADASVNLVKGDVSIFTGTLGLGVETGIGIKDESLSVKVLGTGISIGRVLEVSALGSGIKVDLGKLADIPVVSEAAAAVSKWVKMFLW